MEEVDPHPDDLRLHFPESFSNILGYPLILIVLIYETVPDAGEGVRV